MTGEPSDRPLEPPESRSARYRAAALSAEYDIGRREKTERDARRNILVRIGVILAGTLLCLAGLAMLVLPGPGIVVLLIGLALLAQELAWAERLLTTVKRKAHVDQMRKQPAWVKVVMAVATVIGLGASVAWALAT